MMIISILELLPTHIVTSPLTSLCSFCNSRFELLLLATEPVSKTEGNTYATLLHHPFLFKGKPTRCSRGSSSPWVFDTGSVAKISNSKQELQNEQRLVEGEATMYVGSDSKVDKITIAYSLYLRD